MDPPLDEVIHNVERLSDKVQRLEGKIEKLKAKLGSTFQESDVNLQNNPSTSGATSNQVEDLESNTPLNSSSLESQPVNSEDEVWKLVFAKLDLQSLKNIRLVSKSWNLYAISALSKNSHLNLLKWDSSPTTNTSLFNTLYDIISHAPDGLFANVTVKGCSLEGEQGECKLLFREFGSKFTSLTLHYPSFVSINATLVDYCPNLDELSIIYGGDYCETDDDGNDFSLPSEPLKIKTLKVDVQYTDDDYLLVSNIPAAPYTTIAKSSPDLTILSLNHPRLCDNFFNGIKHSSDITKRITTLEIHGGFDEDYNSLQNLITRNTEFSDELQDLTVRQNNPLLPQLLNKVGRNLKKLKLGGPLSLYFICDMDLDPENLRILPSSELSPMDNVKSFTFELYCSIPSSNKIGSLDFLKKMSNVDTMSLQAGYAALDYALLNSKELEASPVQGLKSLNIVGTIQNVISFHMIRGMFPHLQKLSLTLNTGRDEREKCIEGQKWFEQVVAMISHLVSLKELHMNFNWSDCKNFEDVLKPLKNLNNMTYLEISSISKSKPVPGGLEKAVVEIPNLRQLKLNNFLMPFTEAKKLLEVIGGTKIDLEVSDTLPECRPCESVETDDDDDED